jgi:single-stranded-DNA-specific exonuclease
MEWVEAIGCNDVYKAAIDLGYSDIVANLLSKKISDVNKLENYLDPKIKNLMPNPSTIKDMDKGANYLFEAIKQKRNIAIFGDYDVDGACSSAILARYLKYFDIDAKIYIPDRIMEGYGPNINALRALKAEGYDLIITVDCGTTAFDALEEASKEGLDVLVVDHHLSEAKIPEAIAVINPNRQDDDSSLGFLCGAGVCFMLVVAVNQLFKSRSESLEFTSKLPNILILLDLVALATVCDVVPLVELNRAFVNYGLRLMQLTENPGLRELFSVANIDVNNKIKSYHLGFMIGPRINAGGRVGKSTIAAELLSQSENVHDLSVKLDYFNKERRAIEQIVLEKAFEQINQQNLSENKVIIVANENWHPGVIGIVASRIKDKYQKPTAVIALENNIGKASARSVEGINLGAFIHKAKSQDLLIAGGGHAMAAGFTIAEDKISDFSNFMQTISDQSIHNAEYDLELKLSDVNLNLYDELSILEPYGKDNEEPIFKIADLSVSKHFFMQEKHLKLMIVDKNTGVLGNKVESILWNFDQFDIWDKIQNQSFSVICKLEESIWNGNRNIRLNILKFLF